VFFGAWVTLEDEQGLECVYRVVGADEFDPGKGWISMDSPMAKALMQKVMNDEITVETPDGKLCYIITSVHYSKP
jgi:transcription elongation factor GreB